MRWSEESKLSWTRLGAMRLTFAQKFAIDTGTLAGTLSFP